MAQPKQQRAGDYTGQQKAAQQKEALQEQRDAAAEMSMASTIEAEEIQSGVFDPHTQQRIEGDVEEVQVVDSPKRDYFQPKQTTEPVFTGYETEEQMEPFLASQPEPPQPQFLLREPFVRIRTNQDIDNMTYGFRNGEPNNMSFKEGYLYEVPLEVAEHLNDRGVVARYEGG